MAIKMIVTDLDGTFYHKDMTYDRERFKRLYSKMVENDIRFVVASGNQYYQLISFFDNPEELTFVSENGGYIVKENKELFSVKISDQTYHKVLDELSKHSEVKVNIVCGKKSAYVHESLSDELYNIFIKYFPVMQRVKDLHQVDDQIIKFALICEEDKLEELAFSLNETIDDNLTVVTSGNDCIDLIVTGVHKGSAVQRLMDIWDIKSDEVMAFGDAYNDKEMLKLAGYGFVMANGDERLKKEVGMIAPLSNEEDGELELIEEYFNDSKAFLEKYKC